MLGGSLLGTSPVTSYIESGAGVGVGARTGLASVVTGVLLLLSLFFAPVVALVGQSLGQGGVERRWAGVVRQDDRLNRLRSQRVDQ